MRKVLSFIVFIDELDGTCRYFDNTSGVRFACSQIDNSFVTLDFTIHDVGDLFDVISAGVKFGYFVNITWQLRNYS